MTTSEILKKWDIRVVEKDGKKGLGVTGKLTPKEAAEIKAKKEEIIAELERRSAEKEAEIMAKEAARKEERKAIRLGEKMITVSWHDGEYLSGWEVTGQAETLLEEIGAAKCVDGWGWLVDVKLVEKYGQEFTYQDVLEFVKPYQKEEIERIEKEIAKTKAKFEEARKNGKPVEIRHFSTGCSDPKEECSMDIVTVWAMPDGTQKETRVHTW